MIPHRQPGAGIQWDVSEQSDVKVEEQSLWSVGTQSGRRVDDK
jgi:hypothetical protein